MVDRIPTLSRGQQVSLRGIIMAAEAYPFPRKGDAPVMDSLMIRLIVPARTGKKKPIYEFLELKASSRLPGPAGQETKT